MAPIYAFGESGEFELDTSTYQVRLRGQPLALKPKTFDVLAYLVAHRDRVVPTEELFAKFWPPSISPSVLAQCMTAARHLLGDDAAEQRIIRTYRGRGYRFVASLTQRDSLDGSEPTPAPRAAERILSESVAAAGEEVFVGRVEALQRLSSLLDDAFAGRGRCVLVAGEPGIGKTRIAAHFSAMAMARGALALTGRCHEEDGAPAFWPFIQVLRGCFEGFDPATLPGPWPGASEMGEFVPQLRERWPELARPDPLPPEQARFRLFDWITTLLTKASRPRPLVIVLDDLHWADAGSLKLLRFLAHELVDARLLILGTHRDALLSRDHPLAELLGAISRERACQRIALRGFSRDEVASLMTESTGLACPEELVRVVHEATGGNPFFVQEVTRLLVREGRMTGPPPTNAESTGLPQGVREAIEHRLRTLHAETILVLGAAAVLGHEFASSLLEQLLSWPRPRLLERLEEATAARILNEAPPRTGRFSFTHTLVRAAILAGIAHRERAAFHLRVAEILEADTANVESRLGEIAHHHFQAATPGAVDKALSYTLRAAKHAFDTLAYEQSALHCERALQLLSMNAARDELAECRILLRLGSAQSVSGQRDEARRTFARARDLARSVGRPDYLARAAIGLAEPNSWGLPLDDLACAALEEARGVLTDDSSAALRAVVLACLSGILPYSQSLDERRRRSEEALDLADRANHQGARLRALIARHWSLVGPDHIPERLALIDRLSDLSEKTHDKMAAAAVHYFRYVTHTDLGEFTHADQDMARYADVVREFRRPADLWLLTWTRAARALSRGELDDAERLIEEALAFGERAQHPGAPHVHAAQSVWLSFQRGRLDDVATRFAPFVQAHPWARRLEQANRLFSLCERGVLPEAKEELDRLAERDFSDFPRDEHWLHTMWLIGAASGRLGDQRRASVLYGMLEPFAERIALDEHTLVHSGSVSTVLAMLAATLERWDASVEHAKAAVARNAAIECAGYLTYARLEYARVLVVRGRVADRRLVRELATGAVDEARRLGMSHLLARASTMDPR